MLWLPTGNCIGWSSAIPWLFSLGALVAFGVPALGQSFNALPLSVTVTVPVGQGNAVTGLDDQHGFPLFAPLDVVTATCRMEGEPYVIFCAAWLTTGLLFASNVTKLMVVLLV